MKKISSCAECGAPFNSAGRGRPRTTCSPGCHRRRRMYQKRRERGAEMVETRGRCRQCGRVSIVLTFPDIPDPYLICDQCQS